MISYNHVQVFLKAIKTDKNLRNELKKALGEFTLTNFLCEFSFEEQTKFIKHVIVTFAQKHGFNFTVSDVVLSECQDSGLQQLSDDDVNRVVGGVNSKLISGVLFSAQILSLLAPFQNVSASNAGDIQDAVTKIVAEETNQSRDEYLDLLDVLKNFKNIEPVSELCPFNEVDGMLFAMLASLPVTSAPKLSDANSSGGITLKEWYDSIIELMENVDTDDAANLTDAHILQEYLGSYVKNKGFKNNFYGKKAILLSYMAQCPRYQNIKVVDSYDKYFDITKEEPEQFAAVTFSCEDDDKIVAFRGTDATFAGWKENLDFSWSSNVPAQRDALEYLQKINKLYPFSHFTVVGHSKGGNLAQYSAFKLADKNPGFAKLLDKIFNYDGPGLRSDIVRAIDSKIFDEVSTKLISVIPPLSIIGRIMSGTSKGKFLCAFSSAKDVMGQHNCFGWKITPEYYKKDCSKFQSYEVKTESDLSEQVIESFLDALDKDSMRIFSDWLFKFLIQNKLGFGCLENPKSTLKELFKSYFIKNKSFSEIIKSVLSPGKTVSLSQEQQKSFSSVMKTMFNAAVGVYWDKCSVVNDLVGLSPDLSKAVFEMRNSHYDLFKIGNVISIVSSKIFSMENVAKFIKSIFDICC